MERTGLTTREAILDAGKNEFLDKGFQSASLRRIVRQAGVTTGAFYSYLSRKADLFDALAEPAHMHLSCFT